MHRFYAVFTVESVARLIRRLQLEDTPYAAKIESSYRQYGGIFVFHLIIHNKQPRIALRFWKEHADIVYAVVDGNVITVKDRVVPKEVKAQLETVFADFANIPQLTINTSGYPEELREVPVLDPELWNTIQKIEDSRGIRTQLLMRVGSRAWGYANASSDTDLILVYVQHPWMQPIDCRLEGFRASFAVKGEQYEVQAFELRKFMGMLARCDPYMVTTMHADILIEARGAYHALRAVTSFYMNRNALIEALRGQAKGNITAVRATHIASADVIYGFMAALRAEHLMKTGVFAVKIDELQTSFGTPEDIRTTIEGLRTADEQRFCDFVCTGPGNAVTSYFNSLKFPAYPEHCMYPDKRNKDLEFANKTYSELCRAAFYGL